MHLTRRPLLALLASLVALPVLVSAGPVAAQDPPVAAPPPARPTLPPPTPQEVARASILLKAPKPRADGVVGDPYPLEVCIVGGEPLGKDAVTLVLAGEADPLQEGRQLRFCCEKCLATFKSNPSRYLTALDAEIVAMQSASYPLTHCLVRLERKLGDDAEAIVYGNRLFKVCDAASLNNFRKSLDRYVQAYDKAVTVKQRNRYPLGTCVVSGEKLPEKPFDVVIGQRLFRLCSEKCAEQLYADPKAYAAKLDEAAAAAAAAATPAKN
jgi:YHS domain-containing protein